MPLFSRDDLKEYALRQLGKPVIRINVDDSQLEDCIDDCLDYWFEFHGDGTQKRFIAYTLTATDIANQAIEVDESAQTVVRILPYGAADAANSFNLEYQAFFTDLIQSMKNPYGGGLGSYTIQLSYYNTLQQYFNREKMAPFNRVAHRLQIFTDWSALSEGDIIVMEIFEKITPVDWPDVWNNIWVKGYTTSLFKKQWGMNMKKYQGFVLPSGMVLDGQTIYDEALAEIEQHKIDLREIWEYPVDVMIG